MRGPRSGMNKNVDKTGGRCRENAEKLRLALLRRVMG